ncbi:MAG TPA: MFS transporter [Streptosporangiaceae bacterium]|nr:MFS transporter [Streptosporangiaceae bacterium]
MAAAGPSACPLWRDRNFGIFWAAQTLSVAGDSFAYIAIPLLVLHATGSVAQMGLLTGIGGAASVGAGIFAGVLADRLDRRTLLICCDLARMVLYGIIPLVWSFGPEVWLLYVVLPACAAIGMVFQVTYVTAVRNLTDGERVTEANGLLYATATAAGVLGPLLAGLMSGAFGPTAAIAIDAASFALSAAGAAAIRLRGQGTPVSSTRRSAWAELLAGARFLWRHPVLRALTATLTLFIFLTYGLTDVLIYYLRHGLGQSYAAIGVVLAIAAVGPVGGSMLVARLRRAIGFGASWIGGVAACGIAIACLGASASIPAIAALAATYLGCAAVAGICSMSLRQQVTPDHLLGRVTSAFWTIHFSLGPVGAAVLTWAAGRYGVGAVCAAAGAGCLLIAAAALFTPIRQPAPETA